MSAGPGAWAGRGAAVGLSGPCRGAARGLPWARLRPPSSLRAVSVAAAPSLSPPPDPRTRRFPPPPLWAPRPACVGGTGGLRASGGDPRKAGPGGGVGGRRRVRCLGRAFAPPTWSRKAPGSGGGCVRGRRL